MTDIVGWEHRRMDRPARGIVNRANAEAGFERAKQLAAVSAMRLIKKSSVHYQLENMDRTWLQNIYPGNQRPYFDLNRPAKPAYLHLPEPWTLCDVVRLAGTWKCGRCDKTKRRTG